MSPSCVMRHNNAEHVDVATDVSSRETADGESVGTSYRRGIALWCEASGQAAIADCKRESRQGICSGLQQPVDLFFFFVASDGSGAD